MARAILITGASSGIGKALAEFYAGPGAFLALSGRDAVRLAAVANTCRARGAIVETAVLDVTDRAAMRGWVTAVDDAHPLDLVIANAGISGGTGGTGGVGEPDGQAKQIFNINVNGVLNTIDPVIPRMAARGRGQVALMSSLASFCGWPGSPAYSASKGAVRMYGEALRGALKNKGVKVNVICPGFVETPMTNVNGYKMPFLMPVEKSVPYIVNGLAQNRARIAFPWQTYMIAGFIGLLPPAVMQRVLARTPEKPAAGK